jgi:hypothetical protein
MIRLNQSKLTKELHWYLYGKDSVDTELVEIYERLDHAAENFESDEVEAAEAEAKRLAEQEMKEVQEELKKLVKGFKGYNRAEIKEILERILL